MGTIIELRPGQPDQRAIAQVISASLITYTDALVRQMITAERLLVEDHQRMAETIVSGWTVHLRMEAQDTAHSERERIVFQYVSEARRGEPLHTLALAQVCQQLKLLASEVKLREQTERLAPLASPD